MNDATIKKPRAPRKKKAPSSVEERKRARIDFTTIWPATRLEIPVVPPPSNFEPPDVKKLARANPTPFDQGIRFRESDHRYVFYNRGEWVNHGVMSVSSVLKFGFPEPSEEKLDFMAMNVLKSLKRRVESVSLDVDEEYLAAVLPRLHIRDPRVRKHVEERGPHLALLLGILKSHKEEKDYYDEVVLYFLERNYLVRDDCAYHFTITDVGCVRAIRAYWESTADNGTAMHLEFEQHFNGISPAVKNHDFNRLTRWLETESHKYGKVFRTEVMVYMPALRITGSIDLLMYDEKTGEYTVCDYKKTKSFTTEYDKNPRGYTPDGDIVEDGTGTPFGGSKKHKYECQVALYALQLILAGYNVTRTVLLQIEPRTDDYVAYEMEDVRVLDEAMLALLKAREASLYA